MPNPINMFVNPNNVGMVGIRYFNGVNSVPKNLGHLKINI